MIPVSMLVRGTYPCAQQPVDIDVRQGRVHGIYSAGAGAADAGASMR